MFSIGLTRFNNKTWRENQEYKQKQNISGCIYGVPVRVCEHLAPEYPICVLECNNSINQIIGIGFIKNIICTKKYYKIYSEGNYNRYTYLGNKYLSINELDEEDQLYIKNIENIIFKTKKHMKRGQGITLIGEERWLPLLRKIEKHPKTWFVELIKKKDIHW